MGAVLAAVVSSLVSFCRSRRALQLEILALRHQEDVQGVVVFRAGG